MFARKNSAASVEKNDLVLRGQDGGELITIPSEIVDNMSRMLTELMYQSIMPRTLSCLSALSGEGVTFNTLALAATLASDVEAKVCLVELNWWLPGLQRMLMGEMNDTAPRRWQKQQALLEKPALAVSPGVAGVLRGTATLEESLIKTGIPNLDLLPAGDLPLIDRAAIARGETLKQFLATLREEYEYVILDVPALAVTSDAIALASLGDATAVIVLQGVTQTTTVKAALDSIKHMRILGVVFNRVKMHTPHWILRALAQE